MALESGQSVSFDLKDIFTLDLNQWLMSNVSLGMGVGGAGVGEGGSLSAKKPWNIDKPRIFPWCPNLTLNLITDFIKHEKHKRIKKNMRAKWGGGGDRKF